MVSNINPNPFTTRPEIEGTFGVVATTHWIATAVGMAMLEKGGNAFDAAAATAFTLQVVEPHLNGPGGDVPVIVHDVRRGKPEVICGQGPAPAGATIAHYRDDLASISSRARAAGRLRSGHFDDWMLLLRDYGTMRLADVLAPAIGYARQRLSAGRARSAPPSPRSRTSSAIIGRPPPRFICPTARCRRPAPSSRNPTWPTTYARILREAQSGGGSREAEIERARKSWSQGFVAEAIDRFCRTQEVMDTSGGRHRGVLNGRGHGGLAGRASRRRSTLRLRPLHGDEAGPWSQGPSMLQQLALLKGYDLDALAPTERRFHPSAGRGDQARLRRPRYVLRRPEIRQSAGRCRCCRTPTTTSGGN